MLGQVLLIVVLTATFVVHMTPAVLALSADHPQKFTIALVNLVPGAGFILGFALLEGSPFALRRALREEASDQRSS
jgi:hypothetical protein